VIHLKHGVRLIGLTPQIAVAIVIAGGVYDREGLECVVTSLADGKHMRGSLHYVGAAVDFRLPDKNELGGTEGEALALAENLRQRLAEALGPDFDVVDEGDHLHAEWQPKEHYA
jgi:hypothetical protein